MAEVCHKQTAEFSIKELLELTDVHQHRQIGLALRRKNIQEQTILVAGEVVLGRAVIDRSVEFGNLVPQLSWSQTWARLGSGDIVMAGCRRARPGLCSPRVLQELAIALSQLGLPHNEC